MDILDNLLQGALGGGQQGGSALPIDVSGLANQFGLSPDQANAAVGALLPAVLGGLHKSEESGGLGGVADIVAGMGAPHEDIEGWEHDSRTDIRVQGCQPTGRKPCRVRNRHQ